MRSVVWIALGLFAGACERDEPYQQGTVESSEAQQAERMVSGAEAQMREDRLQERIEFLEGQLSDRNTLLLSRQEELMRFQASLALIQAPPESDLAIEARGPGVDPGPDTGNPGLDPAVQRAKKLRATLQGLLAADGVHSYQFLTLGRLSTGYAGPVVLRLINARGQPSGLIAAERLRLEASRAGHTVTLVLEEGYEEHGGVSVPFDGTLGVTTRGQKSRGGVRRVVLPGVDPVPWIEALGELFGAEVITGPPNDGLWNLITVRQEMNRLLVADQSSGSWRLGGLGGIVAGVLRDVQLVELDGKGRPLRRLFADALSIEEGDDGGLRLVLTDGVQMVGQERTPFIEGRFLLVLPKAVVAHWRAGGLPGLVPRPTQLAR